MDPVFFAKDFWRENFCWGGSWCAWKTTTCWSMSLWRNHPDHHHAPPRIWMKLIRTSNCFFFYKKVGEMGIQSKSLCFLEYGIALIGFNQVSKMHYECIYFSEATKLDLAGHFEWDTHKASRWDAKPLDDFSYEKRKNRWVGKGFWGYHNDFFWRNCGTGHFFPS